MGSDVIRSGNVVLVHGIFDAGEVFRKMSDCLTGHGFTTYMPDLKPSSGSKGVDHLALRLQEYVERHLSGDDRFSLIGFSMGGLVCRYYLQKLDGIRRVDRFITLSAPHNGSLLAYAFPHRGAVQMRPGSDFLNDLNRDAGILKSLRPVSMWTPFDLSIVPATSSIMPGFTEVRLPVLLHPWMLTNRRSIDVVVRELVGG
ncbi:MAG: alpha/beta fold hydrolase [Chlorobiaceae bacterium]|nr:alpha/beta fold hydrolase [Chlorobiaceae bacterium]